MSMTLDDQIKSVTYEIARRKAVYPKYVLMGDITSEMAEHEIAAMEAVLATLLDRKIELTAKVAPS
jgi:hypothetical protein